MEDESHILEYLGETPALDKGPDQSGDGGTMHEALGSDSAGGRNRREDEYPRAFLEAMGEISACGRGYRGASALGRGSGEAGEGPGLEGAFSQVSPKIEIFFCSFCESKRRTGRASSRQKLFSLELFLGRFHHPMQCLVHRHLDPMLPGLPDNVSIDGLDLRPPPPQHILEHAGGVGHRLLRHG